MFISNIFYLVEISIQTKAKNAVSNFIYSIFRLIEIPVKKCTGSAGRNYSLACNISFPLNGVD